MLSVVFVIAALVVSGTTASTVTAMCETGPKVTFSITGATDGSTVFSVGTGCASTVVAAGVSPHIHVMTASAGCTFSATNPITLVIQKSNSFLTSSDEVFAVTCGTIVSNPQEASVTLANAALQASSSVSSLGPTVTFEVTDNGGSSISSASIGASVNLKVSISAADNGTLSFASEQF
ncbi:hypothetical protein DPMN_033132 [Dreissena polymorpha]|uniref:GPI-anchored surface protein n=1 Tax=Dreissena polymorpha TaxID=45954 RepID=A0A9D4RIW9_DREPO|nr:hypothetical protein DPMN_033132 [Dreissena polymorpha]